jgi:hypothetical protein
MSPSLSASPTVTPSPFSARNFDLGESAIIDFVGYNANRLFVLVVPAAVAGSDGSFFVHLDSLDDSDADLYISPYEPVDRRNFAWSLSSATVGVNETLVILPSTTSTFLGLSGGMYHLAVRGNDRNRLPTRFSIRADWMINADPSIQALTQPSGIWTSEDVVTLPQALRTPVPTVTVTASPGAAPASAPSTSGNTQMALSVADGVTSEDLTGVWISPSRLQVRMRLVSLSPSQGVLGFGPLPDPTSCYQLPSASDWSIVNVGSGATVSGSVLNVSSLLPRSWDVKMRSFDFLLAMASSVPPGRYNVQLNSAAIRCASGLENAAASLAMSGIGKLLLMGVTPSVRIARGDSVVAPGSGISAVVYYPDDTYEGLVGPPIVASKPVLKTEARPLNSQYARISIKGEFADNEWIRSYPNFLDTLFDWPAMLPRPVMGALTVHANELLIELPSLYSAPADSYTIRLKPGVLNTVEATRNAAVEVVLIVRYPGDFSTFLSGTTVRRPYPGTLVVTGSDGSITYQQATKPFEYITNSKEVVLTYIVPASYGNESLPVPELPLLSRLFARLFDTPPGKPWQTVYSDNTYFLPKSVGFRDPPFTRVSAPAAGRLQSGASMVTLKYKVSLMPEGTYTFKRNTAVRFPDAFGMSSPGLLDTDMVLHVDRSPPQPVKPVQAYTGANLYFGIPADFRLPTDFFWDTVSNTTEQIAIMSILPVTGDWRGFSVVDVDTGAPLTFPTVASRVRFVTGSVESGAPELVFAIVAADEVGLTASVLYSIPIVDPPRPSLTIRDIRGGTGTGSYPTTLYLSPSTQTTLVAYYYMISERKDTSVRVPQLHSHVRFPYPSTHLMVVVSVNYPSPVKSFDATKVRLTPSVPVQYGTPFASADGSTWSFTLTLSGSVSHLQTLTVSLGIESARRAADNADVGSGANTYRLVILTAPPTVDPTWDAGTGYTTLPAAILGVPYFAWMPPAAVASASLSTDAYIRPTTVFPADSGMSLIPGNLQHTIIVGRPLREPAEFAHPLCFGGAPRKQFVLGFVTEDAAGNNVDSVLCVPFASSMLFYPMVTLRTDTPAVYTEGQATAAAVFADAGLSVQPAGAQLSLVEVRIVLPAAVTTVGMGLKDRLLGASPDASVYSVQTTTVVGAPFLGLRLVPAFGSSISADHALAFLNSLKYEYVGNDAASATLTAFADFRILSNMEASVGHVSRRINRVEVNDPPTVGAIAPAAYFDPADYDFDNPLAHVEFAPAALLADPDDSTLRSMSIHISPSLVAGTHGACIGSAEILGVYGPANGAAPPWSGAIRTSWSVARCELLILPAPGVRPSLAQMQAALQAVGYSVTNTTAITEAATAHLATLSSPPAALGSALWLLGRQIIIKVEDNGGMANYPISRQSAPRTVGLYPTDTY